MEYGNPGNERRNEPAGPLLQRKLRRSGTDKLIAGVIGGIGETYGINSTLLRILFVASFLLPGPQMLFYFVMWFIMPRPGTAS
ncbi:PspC domain-containing protein [Corynebacterium pygosceleis]|uniref:PspC domain-containing protein n=1 Tax=Corynebacterium pygosceleis TaxID=2800406 RepID=A0A9Q4C9M2_9CORY|nr:PspC domain-containing protein [Corynebacterium pygosceleis]MCK7637942.1 PspC domain-containing protein [Corynebacterium pygosceleis]MCK7675657.1 PspC domain-containing protein [Corynebacterium pygosceleis]MCL0120949.1 PspC domain-containing protein [Corynebacterium pygosceleis]MCX7444518.1 PspC domain-containing protein [Corynebacterium pygosceleis]MCX7468658.1 PspC domain-containing protein [Corynebacterium pygosceleis]